jgi:hypothetical protein
MKGSDPWTIRKTNKIQHLKKDDIGQRSRQPNHTVRWSSGGPAEGTKIELGRPFARSSPVGSLFRSPWAFHIEVGRLESSRKAPFLER